MILLYLKTLKSERSQAATHQDRCYNNTQCGGKDELSLGSLCVPDGQSKGDGPTETSKHQHVLKTKVYLLGTSKIENERENINVYNATSKNCNLYIKSR